jgi:hypothetical protein
MRKIRNPRYAPEFLERKLSPSSMVYAPAAQVEILASADDGPTYPPDDPTDPVDPTDPTTPPSDPGGPSGPCSTLVAQ